MKRPIIAAVKALKVEISTLLGIASPITLVMGQFFVSSDQAAVESMVGKSNRLISTFSSISLLILQLLQFQ